MIFTIDSDHSTNPNRIAVPVLKLIYGEVNITNVKKESFNVYLDFKIQIEFVKNYEFSSMFDVTQRFAINGFDFTKITFCLPQIVLSSLLVAAFIISLFRAYGYKTRQQRQLYDIDIFFQFVVFLTSNVANALFVYATFISVYALIIIRTQSVVKILLPIDEQGIVEIFIYVAVALKVKFKFQLLYVLFTITKDLLCRKKTLS